MTEEQRANAGAGPEAVVRHRRGPSLVWLIPLVAALVGGALAYRTISERGPLVKIQFASAAGIEAGQTTIRYRAVPVGLVEAVSVSGARLDHVDVKARFHEHAKPLLVDGSRFWVVTPHIGVRGVSGLDTLISGAYIAVEPGKLGGAEAREFTGLDEPPLIINQDSGLNLILTADRLAGINAGDPIYHRDIQTGQVEAYKLDEAAGRVQIFISMDEQYAGLVRDNSRFWNVSGVNVSAGLDGVKVKLESLDALVAGGIAFATPEPSGARASKNTRFHLPENRETAFRTIEQAAGLHVIVQAHRRGSIKANDPVYYRQERVGSVLSHELRPDARSVAIHLQIEAPYDRLVREDSVFWDVSGIRAKLGLTGVKIETESVDALLEGGIAFATPDAPGTRVRPDTVFKLHGDADKRWLDWSPRIWVGEGADPGSAGPSSPRAAADRSSARDGPPGNEPHVPIAPHDRHGRGNPHSPPPHAE